MVLGGRESNHPLRRSPGAILQLLFLRDFRPAAPRRARSSQAHVALLSFRPAVSTAQLDPLRFPLGRCFLQHPGDAVSKCDPW